MLLRHITIACFVAANAFAADVRLGPEVPIVPVIRTGPAAYGQSVPAVASNGRDFLAIWHDSREQTALTRFYTSRLDAAGRPFEPFGRRFRPGGYLSLRPLIASDGADYLVVWLDQTEQKNVAQRLDENGSPAGAMRELGSGGQLLTLASDGSGYLLVTRENQGFMATSLDRDGSVRATFSLQLAEYLSLDVAGGIYSILGFESGCCICFPAACSRPVLRTIDARGPAIVVTTTVLPEFASGSGHAANASSDRILFAWSPPVEGGRIQFTMLDRSGNLVKSVTEVNLPGIYPVRILHSGNEFLLISQGYALSVHVRADGSVVNAEPYTLPEAPQFASNGSTLTMLSADGGDIVSRSLRGFDDLALAPIAATVVASSGRAQDGVRIARAASHEMIVWKDDSAHEILGTIDGVEITIDRQQSRIVGSPTVTAGTDQFLVAWSEVHSAELSTRLLARRYAFDGTALDGQPIALASGFFNQFDDDPGVAADGSSFVIADDSQQDMLRLLRLDGATGVSSELWRYPCELCRGSFRPVRTTSGWMVPHMRYVGFFSPHVFTTWGITIAETTLSGIPVRSIATPFTGTDFFCARLAAAQRGDQLSVVLPYGNAIQVVRTTAPDPLKLAERDDVAGVELAWNGSEYVLVWTSSSGGPIRAKRFDADFHPLYAAPFEIASTGSTQASPSIAVTDRGVVIAYSRSTPENGWAPRAFTRTLDRLSPSIVRRRGVRH